MPFAVLALAACLLMARIARDPRGGRLATGRSCRGSSASALLIGLAALTRNEAHLHRPGLAHRRGRHRRAWTAGRGSGLIAAVAGVAFLVFLPWAIRDWLTFGSPLPGQAVANAFSISGFDIFAWNDPPTLARYLAVGPARLLEMRVDGFAHNLFSVLLLPGLPVSLIGLIGLPWAIRGAAIRPLVIVSFAAFLVTSLVFPVATTWGTFLHAAGPFQVLLVISALLALDALIARVGLRLGWTRPVAWLGPLLGIFGSLLFSVALLPSFGSGSSGTAEQYRQLAAAMAGIGHPLDASAGPVITNFPIWMAETPADPRPGTPRRAAA